MRPADSPLPPDLETTLRGQLQQLALTSSQQALPGVNRVDIEVGQLDPRLHLAPCQRVEPYLPNGTRLWGKARIGLRCTQGQTAWNVYLPITVRVYGAAWVASSTLAVGAVLGANDLVQGEVDLAEDSAPVVSDPDQAIGRTLLRRITAGQGLRTTDLRPRQWFAAGDVVKLVASGPGFSVTGSGEAMNHGLEGQTVRVRIADKDGAGRPRIVTGQATGDRLVEVRP
jgi:flagella basal body P-ring formation protein FlgA